MKTVLRIVILKRDGCRDVIHTSYVTSDIESFRKCIKYSNSEIENVFFVYEETIE